MKTIIYKVGGSLLDLPDLASRLLIAIEQNSDSRPLLVLGGGRAADVVREWDRIHHLDEESSHWLALDAMRLNESFLQNILPNSRIVTTRQEAQATWDASGIPILSSGEFLRAEESTSRFLLPHTWDVTSDSIAAWIALQWPADGLVLLKSASPPDNFASFVEGVSIETNSVDPYFFRLASDLPSIDWLNLRADERIRANQREQFHHWMD
ncbi:MAG: hypothetical protein IID46_02125 [Planctomycetes bacterium]|nr:hypothetical protein [Planctomycetota bacterium]